MKIRSLDGKTPDIAEENIQKLRQIFPDVFTEDKIDFGKLQQVLGEYVEDSTERYNFTWNGKGRALRLSQTPSLGTLRPCKEESKDWDTTQNLYIEGDNLEVLKLLQKSYYGKVKIIYIDPPYNTGKDFVYPDDFHDSLENYKKITGQVDDNGNRISTNTETSGRYHTDWLNMMYPRLRLARNLLADDGVIFISIDDNEVDNLKKICNEVFGEDNFVAQITREAIKGGSVSKNIRNVHDFVLIFAKQIDNIEFSGIEMAGLKLNLEDEKGKYAKGRELNKWGAGSRREDAPGMYFPVKGPNGEDIYPIRNDGSEGRWRLGKQKMTEIIENKDVIFEKRENGSYIIYEKLRNDSPRKKQFISIFKDEFINAKGTEEIKKLFEVERGVFDFSKPVNLITAFLIMAASKDSLILDFFSGSATTAHAVMQLNAEDGGNRKFIMVQLPEATDEKSEAYKNGYKNICEIGKERIRRAGEKIKEKNKDKENIENLDIGFKVLKLDTSNIRKWQPDYDNLEQSLLDYVDNYVDGRTELDVVYEIMIKYGLDLTYPVDEFTVAQKKVYSIGFGMLMICLDDEITTEVARGILAKAKELSPESTRVVFKDNGFKTDSNKTNIKEILKCGGIEEFITL
ncbi:site-specific DNA-methyltransferase [Enterococcus cecorum]|uniref:site-specific DNA-methyltransferase n=1 Tax=Enterococcus cecorum TaxID=44008 RepID=UPI001FAD3D31|nr:site-specific DNA-methyltransferase [Enterococcus cecorum]MCJ0542738.1 site-specific DNA-methyltransferase [Enterococcus cecorum]MCJ0547472.1 site-specific DNA-methyltransferase [Enterococcus cecorum]